MTTIPTIGFNVETIQSKHVNFAGMHTIAAPSLQTLLIDCTTHNPQSGTLAVAKGYDHFGVTTIKKQKGSSLLSTRTIASA